MVEAAVATAVDSEATQVGITVVSRGMAIIMAASPEDTGIMTMVVQGQGSSLPTGPGTGRQRRRAGLS